MADGVDRAAVGGGAAGAAATARLAADKALRLAITLAVEAGDYDRAIALLQVARGLR
jgi:hypothetical protein